MLKTAGFDAVHWADVGAMVAADETIMTFAASTDCVVLTHDLNFGAILAVKKGEKPNVVQIRAEDVSPNAIGSTVITALRQVRPELEAGALLTIDHGRCRLWVLPLQR